jgi:Bacterial transcriptional activator domain
MLALYRCDLQAKALDAHRRARATLVSDVGVAPEGRFQLCLGSLGSMAGSAWRRRYSAAELLSVVEDGPAPASQARACRSPPRRLHAFCHPNQWSSS